MLKKCKFEVMNQIRCPNCGSYYVRKTNKHWRSLWGMLFVIIGLGTIYQSFGNPLTYLISLPLTVYGLYLLYLAYTNAVAKGKCKACNFQFDYKE